MNYNGTVEYKAEIGNLRVYIIRNTESAGKSGKFRTLSDRENSNQQYNDTKECEIQYKCEQFLWSISECKHIKDGNL
jgi:hypothetical protein